MSDALAKDWEDVKAYTLETSDEAQLLAAQIECTLIWAGKEGWPMGVIVNFIYRNDRFWLTATEKRPRVASIRKDPRVSIAISSKGSSVKHRQSLTYKCHAILHTDEETKNWFFPEFGTAMRPDDPAAATAFSEFLNSESRVILELVPETRIGFDSAKMWKAAPAARPSDAPVD
jgi:hypothetical protein